MLRHPIRAALVAVLTVAALAFGVAWFGPQYLFIDRTVDEPPPSASTGTGARGPGAAPAGRDESSGGASPGGAGGISLAEGKLRPLEHDASGRALVIALPDGSRFLRFEELVTSNGPDLRVYLSDRPASDDWFVYDDGRFVDLGPLKGNLGSSNYEIPREVDLSEYRSAVVWCRRFSVGFAVAPLDPAS
jgi:hypothetical protein